MYGLLAQPRAVLPVRTRQLPTTRRQAIQASKPDAQPSASSANLSIVSFLSLHPCSLLELLVQRRRPISVRIRIALTRKNTKHLGPAKDRHKPPKFITSALASIMKATNLSGKTRETNGAIQKNPYQTTAHTGKQWGDPISQAHADVHQQNRNSQHPCDCQGNSTAHPVLLATGAS